MTQILKAGCSACPPCPTCGSAQVHQSVYDPERCPKCSPEFKKRGSMSTSSTLTKDIIVAHAGRNFRNGNLAFDLTTQNIDEIISNFAKLGKQVPLILAPEHLFGAQKSAIPAAGWIESMHRAGDEW